MNGGYILAFKIEPDLCGVSCPCTVDSSKERREIAEDSLFVDTADAASYHEGDIDG